jgi:glyoxylase-like metal-dependent hydrolase (beta-lactamase superfamily II)
VTPVRVDVPTATRAPTDTTAAYVVDGQPGLLVDPAARTDRLDEAVADHTVGAVAVTHHHPDHVGAVADYARAFGLTVYARRGRTQAFVAATGVEPDRTFGPGTTLPGSGVEVLDTPGHAPEHTAFVTPAGILTGDLAVAEGSVVVGAPEGDVRAYLSSLRRVVARDPDRLFPAHGPTIDDPRATCERLIGHRLRRERRVREAVRGGARTVEEILDAAYEKDLSGVTDLARATVVAHLEKLAVEGAVTWDGDRTPAA